MPRHGPQASEALPESFPGSQFAFMPADISTQILNFGAPAPLDIKVSGRDDSANRAYALELQRRLQHVPGIAVLRIKPERRGHLRAARQRGNHAVGDVTLGNGQSQILGGLATKIGRAHV